MPLSTLNKYLPPNALSYITEWLGTHKTHTQLLTNAIECFLSCFSICYKVSIVIKY